MSNAWKKILAVGCSHGEFANPDALAAVLKFRREFKPDYCVHLGDFIDTRALRGGAQGTKDEAAEIGPDVTAGLSFLEALEPTHVRMGNHDWRAWELMEHPNAIIRHAAKDVAESIKAHIRYLKAKWFPYFGVWDTIDPKSILKIGDYFWCHGVFYGENGNRDHAEKFGNVVHAHDHRPGISKGRRHDNPTAISVGTLSNIGAMHYAARRASTLSWGHGMVWGYVSTGKKPRCKLYLHEWPRGETKWTLPI